METKFFTRAFYFNRNEKLFFIAFAFHHHHLFAAPIQMKSEKSEVCFHFSAFSFHLILLAVFTFTFCLFTFYLFSLYH